MSGAPSRQVALAIAGIDSGGGAGVNADLATFAAHGVWGACAVTAVTAQDTLGVSAVHVVPLAVVLAQIAAVVADLRPAATKVGVLGSAEVAAGVAEALAGAAVGPVVLDPVAASTTGHALLGAGGLEVLRLEVLPHAALVTPNLPEAEALLDHGVVGRAGMEQAAAELLALGAGAVLVKGGHLGGDASPDLLLVAGGAPCWLEGPRLAAAAGAAHGTGCVLSSAITAGLALGRPLEDACRAAKAFTAGAIAGAVAVGRGAGPVDPWWQRPR